jgi:hypothetical protein
MQMNIKEWLPDMDLNHDKQIQSLLCYRYTIGQTSGSKVNPTRKESRADGARTFLSAAMSKPARLPGFYLAGLQTRFDYCCGQECPRSVGNNF